MNIYLVVEGIAEKKIYPKWVKYINPSYRIVDDIRDVNSNNIYIISGRGYPDYFNIIRAGVLDVFENPCFDLLVIAIDSEDMTYKDKREEIKKFIDELGFQIKYLIIVQHFCIETWALGNQSIIPRSTTNEEIKRYREHFDVLTKDPELLTPPKNENANRAQFAYKYLRVLLHEKSPKLKYTKRDPQALMNRDYYSKIKRRYEETRHIASFRDFLVAFN